VFSPRGPSARELWVQAFSSVERGYDLLAPKFDHTPFRTPDDVLDEITRVLSAVGSSDSRPSAAGPFGTGLDLCCGTGAGLGVLQSLCRGQVTGVDFSAGMLAQARGAHPQATLVQADVRSLPFTADFDLAVTLGALGHFLPSERPAVFEGVHRALRPGGVFALPLGEPPPLTSVSHWATLGFDLAMVVRNTVVRPQFVMYYRTATLRAVRGDLVAAGFTVEEIAVSPGYRLLLARKPWAAVVSRGYRLLLAREPAQPTRALR
jgi:ubiquinone/menaquinone biosynthesis C-methylase UbiE